MAKKVDEPRFTRADVARRTGYATNSLILIEQRGVLKPSRNERGYRLYTEADIQMLLKRRARTLPGLAKVGE